MRKVTLAVMATLLMATSAMAMSPSLDSDGIKDYSTFEVEVTVEEEEIVLDGEGWDYFWGTTVRPHWNRFWGSCQYDPDFLNCTAAIVVGAVTIALSPVPIIYVMTSLPAISTLIPLAGLGGGLV